MTIELVKEFDTAGQITYYVRVDTKFQPGTVRSQLTDAMEVYESIKTNYTKAKVEVLIKESL
jgi:hypothetical protein